MAKDESILTAGIPMQRVGPVKITGLVVDDEVMIPLATFESPLWHSTNRGAKVSCQCGGITAVVVDERMTRSILVEAEGAVEAAAFVTDLNGRRDELAAEMQSTSRFAELIDMHTQIVGGLVYIRFEMKTGDAAGHNMVTAAADKAMQWILAQYPDMAYVSISGNYCTDKKNSAVNGILGRGKYVVAELTIPGKVCSRFLKTTPEKIVALNVKKNLIGTMLAGSVRSANAHFANMLLGFYLATGQDAANIVEGSQGFTTAEVRDDALYFAVTLPNIIVGTVGNGKDLDFVAENLKVLGCLEEREAGENARRLAVIAASAVLCGELSLLAAQTNPGELMDAHLRLERKASKA